MTSTTGHVDSAETNRRTVARSATISGLGLFHGNPVDLTLQPAPAGTGIRFIRTDLAERPQIPALVDYVVSAPRRTALQCSSGARVETTEHLMAALAGSLIDDCCVELNAPEPPGLDGSAAGFIELIDKAGIAVHDTPAQVVRTTTPVSVQTLVNRQSVCWEPAGRTGAAIVTYRLNYGKETLIAPQTFTMTLDPTSFAEEVAAARTFIFENEVEQMRAAGFGTHLTARDILVVGSDGPIDNELRWPDEFARHKILDCIGDLALAGVRWEGRITAGRTGHAMNHKLAARIRATALRCSEDNYPELNAA